MTDTLVSQSPVSQSPPAPQPAWGVELFGEYEGSGFKETPYLARRADGQVIRLSHLLYLVAAEADGQRSFAEIASRVSEEFGRAVSADNVRLLVEKVLRPAGVIAAEDGTVPENLSRANPLLALRLRVGLMPARAVRAITTIFWPLFLTPVMIAMLVGLVAVDVWLFFNHGLLQSVQQLLYQPSLIFVLFVLETLAAGFHECGHASACRYGGARPGVLGAGIYIVWFVFYSDVTDTYRLNKAGRLRTDLGGVYFDAIFSLAMAGAYFLTGFEPLLVLVFFNQLGALDEFTPFARFDGYYVISDLTGVPDLFGRIKPILLSLIPGREAEQKVTELKPWARWVVTVWVLTTVPVLLISLVLLIIYGPTLLLSAWGSVVMQSGVVLRSFEAGSITEILGGLIQAGALVAPSVLTAVFVAFMVWRVGRVIASRAGVATWLGLGRPGPVGGPLLNNGLWIAPVSVALCLALFFWLPLVSGNGSVQQIESATPQRGILAVPEIPAHNPAQVPEDNVSKAPRNDGKAKTDGKAKKDAGSEVGEPSHANTGNTGESSHANPGEPSRAETPDTGREDSTDRAAAPQGSQSRPEPSSTPPPSAQQVAPAQEEAPAAPQGSQSKLAPSSTPPPSAQQGAQVPQGAPSPSKLAPSSTPPPSAQQAAPVPQRAPAPGEPAPTSPKQPAMRAATPTNPAAPSPNANQKPVEPGVANPALRKDY